MRWRGWPSGCSNSAMRWRSHPTVTRSWFMSRPTCSPTVGPGAAKSSTAPPSRRRPPGGGTGGRRLQSVVGGSLRSCVVRVRVLPHAGAIRTVDVRAALRDHGVGDPFDDVAKDAAPPALPLHRARRGGRTLLSAPPEALGALRAHSPRARMGAPPGIAVAARSEPLSARRSAYAPSPRGAVASRLVTWMLSRTSRQGSRDIHRA